MIEGKELPYIYKNYIYQGKNWKCPVCNADNGYCEHYYCTLCKKVYSKDRGYKMRLNQQCKCLESSDNSSREGENAY